MEVHDESKHPRNRDVGKPGPRGQFATVTNSAPSNVLPTFVEFGVHRDTGAVALADQIDNPGDYRMVSEPPIHVDPTGPIVQWGVSARLGADFEEPPSFVITYQHPDEADLVGIDVSQFGYLFTELSGLSSEELTRERDIVATVLFEWFGATVDESQGWENAQVELHTDISKQDACETLIAARASEVWDNWMSAYRPGGDPDHLFGDEIRARIAAAGS